MTSQERIKCVLRHKEPDQVPIPDPDLKHEYIPLTEEIRSPINIPSGCRFHTRCPYLKERCRNFEPELREIEKGWFVACHFT